MKKKQNNFLLELVDCIYLPKTMRAVLRLLLIVLVLVPQFSCKAKIKNSSKVAYIIGENDIEPIKNIESVPKNILDAAVFITVKNPYQPNIKTCSASLLKLADGNPVFVLTNRHCFLLSESTPTNSELCRHTTMYLNPLGLNRGEKLTCAENSLHISPDMDLAVFTVNPEYSINNSALQGLELKFDYKSGDNTFLVHYPKTNRDEIFLEDARISVPAPALTSQNCKVMGDFARNLWVQEPDLEYSFAHSCDMTFGSSGSALIDQKTSKIIGLNWGGIELTGDTDDRFRNAAIASIHILTFLESVVDLKNMAHLHATIESNKANLYSNQQISQKEKRSCGSLNARGESNSESNDISILYFLFLILTPFVFSIRVFR